MTAPARVTSPRHLLALRTLLSLATTIGEWQTWYNLKSDRRMQISHFDIVRAYFDAKLDGETKKYFQLPPKDPDASQMCAELLRHMSGTRVAADGWQETYSSTLVKLGFTQSRGFSFVFRHPTRMVVISVQGDDLTAAGATENLD